LLVPNQSHSDTDFAADAIIGFDYAVSPQISIRARYQFLWVISASSGNGVTGSNSDFTGHVLTATATFRF
jgi:opacity protein-like surface antigen